MRNEIMKRFRQNADESYRIFAMRSCPNSGTVYGVRLPALRRIAKDIMHFDQSGLFLKECRYASLEEDLIAALLTAHLDTEDRYDAYRTMISHIHNWEVCDTFCSELRKTIRDRTEFHAFVLSYLSSEQEFEQRFALVALLDLYCKEEPQFILQNLKPLKLHGYYAEMAAAWLIAECMCHDPVATLQMIEQYDENSIVRKKAIQKIKESYRISDSDKLLASALTVR
ncbi:MAG: DNA alkylation repair protein [Solobacterium sp.]|jgi:3-methyladenine DNA glycosylase AlkD|nr:DNA alkylation repair protein [Solobacterium sp.]MCH4222387.1 DNA alkylation repair protein [Solobacterium sp.]MCH4265128.1 DNA alkylation repair protein [Solobacterium sp.]